MNLKKRAATYLRWLNSTMPVERITDELLTKCTNVLTINFQHVHRFAIEDTLRILREERIKSLGTTNGVTTLIIDSVIRKVKQL